METPSTPGTPGTPSTPSSQSAPGTSPASTPPGQGTPGSTPVQGTTGIPGQTTPQTPQKYWDRFESETAAKEYYANMEKEVGSARKFVESVSPFFDIDEATGTVNFKPEKLQPQKAVPTGVDPEIEQLTEFQRDPKGFIRKTTDEIVGQARKQADTEAEQRLRLITDHKGKDEYFDDYLTEVDKAIRRLPAAQRANPGLYDSVYRVVRANDMDRIIESRVNKAMEEKARQSEVIIQTKVESGSGSGKQGATIPISLTPNELRAAQGLGVTPEKYAKNKAEMDAERSKWGR